MLTVTGTSRGGRRTVEGDPEAIFEIGSITKVLTGVLLAELHLSGIVDLDDPLSRHLPELELRWRDREPSLRDLATHRSGLPNSPLERRELLFVLGVRKHSPWAGVTVGAYHDMVRALAAKARHGRVRYSSLGFALLGDALAAAAGRSYGDLLHERVLDPAGMRSTSLEPRGQLAGHSRRGRPRPPLEDLMAPAGGVRSTAQDMLAFLETALDPSPAMALAQSPQAEMGRRMHIGLGWLILRPRHKPPVIWHNGGTWGFRSFAGLVPEHGRAAVVLRNAFRGVDRQGFELLSSDDEARRAPRAP